MAVLTLPFPQEESPEPSVPDRIEHGRDYMLKENGKFEYSYNFLDYYWQFAGEEVRARHYLDGGESRVSVFLPQERLQQDPSLRPMLNYLLRRYAQIDSFSKVGSETYQVAIQVGKPEPMR